MTSESDIARHYSRQGLLAHILGALEQAGRSLDALTRQDLSPIDELHLGGGEATAALVQALDLGPGMTVLDVGSGLGGPTRHVAATCDCRVVGIDLTEDYCHAARDLAQRVGLAGRVSYGRASALALPFADGGFDRVFTEHVAMNIADKATLYAEIHRVLKPGGLFGLYDLLQGEGGEVLYPTPWASEAAASHMVRPQSLRALLTEAGFEILSWQGKAEQARQWLARLRERIKRDGPPPLGLHLVLGADFAEMAANQVRNLAQDRIIPTQVICRKP